MRLLSSPCSSSLASSAAFTIAIAGLLALAGCAKLPENVPCKAEILGSDGELLGRSLAFNGKDVAKIERGQVSGQSLITVAASFSVAKAELPPMLGPGFTVHAAGACGAEDVALEPPGQPWRDMSENQRAKELEKAGAFPILLRFSGFKTQHKLVVDWGAAKSIRVGSIALERGEKPEVQVLFGTCKAPPALSVDGKEVGVLDTNAAIQLISGDPAVCYQMHDVVYGDATSTRPPIDFQGKRSYALKEMPSYVLESAPASTKSRGTGTTLTELIRVRCSR